MRARRMVLGAAAAVLCLVAVLLGGVFDDSSPAGTAVVAPASAGTRVDTGFAQGDTAARDRGPAGHAPRRIPTTCARSTSSRSPTSSARGRRAIRRTTRSRGRHCTARSARAARPRCDERARLARALPAPLRGGARARTPRARDLADDRAELRRDRRRARRARPLPGGISRVRHDGVASAGPVVVRADRACALPGRRPAGRDRVDEARARRRPPDRARRRPGHIFSSESSTGRAARSAAREASSATR